MNPLITDESINAKASVVVGNPLALRFYDYVATAKEIRDLCTAEHERRMADLEARLKDMAEARDIWKKDLLADLRQQVEALTETIESERSIVLNPVAVHINILRGTIKLPESYATPEQKHALEVQVETLTRQKNEWEKSAVKWEALAMSNETEANQLHKALGKELDYFREQSNERADKLAVMIQDRDMWQNSARECIKHNHDLRAEIDALKSSTVPRGVVDEIRSICGKACPGFWRDTVWEIEDVLGKHPSPAPAGEPPPITYECPNCKFITGNTELRKCPNCGHFLTCSGPPESPQPERKYRAIDIQTDVRTQYDEHRSFVAAGAIWEPIPMPWGEPYRTHHDQHTQYRRPQDVTADVRMEEEKDREIAELKTAIQAVVTLAAKNEDERDAKIAALEKQVREMMAEKAQILDDEEAASDALEIGAQFYEQARARLKRMSAERSTGGVDGLTA